MLSDKEKLGTGQKFSENVLLFPGPATEFGVVQREGKALKKESSSQVYPLLGSNAFL